ncbi:hypothetical protein [Aquabacterium sp. OR-4]|uniref:hypothetical protein n=1 Tax=Aquabacterium sp. OR-4 TaxID=2978127 RepID=UPI0021B35695|nr:hypothetical protein [Aquabacterium sp. OR-4]MDT7834945.1 hypothetical protein [Aquabacterium sp. OR-4]
MTNAFTIDTDSALVEEIINAALPHLPSATLAYDSDGDLAGVVYFADETRRHYAADVDALRALIEVVKDTHGKDSYSIWCSQTAPDAEGENEADVMAEMDWTA